MLNDIKEQAHIINSLIDEYLEIDKPIPNIHLSMTEQDLNSLSKIYILASGSSRNAGNISKYFIESITKLPVSVDYSSEFAHRNPCIDKDDLVIVISQSGETADTLAALNVALEKGAYTIALTNKPDSKIANLANARMEIKAGEENSIPATKSFTAQLVNLYILALYLAEQRKSCSDKQIRDLKLKFQALKSEINKFFENIDKFAESLNNIVDSIKNYKDIVLLGRGLYSGLAEEGALKVKETSYINANAYPAGEFLHGYMAILDENIPVIPIIMPGSNYDLTIRNIEEIQKKRNPKLIIIKNDKDKEIESLFKAASFINVPEESILPIFSTIALQLFAMKLAEFLGRDVDKPRGLTKFISEE